MALPHDLLEQALHLANREPRKPKQVSLRRSISTAYYALFHLLIDESKANWRTKGLRPVLARAYDHGTMKNASTRMQNQAFPGANPGTVSKLRFIAATFSQLQGERHDADYNERARWTRTEALQLIDSVQQSFETLEAIRKEPIVQEYLLALLIKHRA